MDLLDYIFSTKLMSQGGSKSEGGFKAYLKDYTDFAAIPILNFRCEVKEVESNE